MSDRNDNPLYPIVHVLSHVVDVVARLLVVLFDGIKDAVDHANPSLFALVATLLPFVLPLPVAFMTAHSAQHFFGWEAWAANVLGFGLEGLGLLAWVKLVDAVLEQIRAGRWGWVVSIYGLVAFVYELLLLFINVVLAQRAGASADYTIVLACICVLPALSALLYGHQRSAVERQLAAERAEAKADAEKIRLERRQDRKEAAQLRAQYASDTKGSAIKTDQPFRGKRS